MKKIVNLVLFLIAASLAACTTNQYQQMTASPQTTTENAVTQDTPLSDNLPRSMDENDKSKMLHALDKSPGKSTTWVNPTSGISYTVVPTQKVVINGNPYCRKYSVTSTKGDNRDQFTGTACVGEDSNWKIAG